MFYQNVSSLNVSRATELSILGFQHVSFCSFYCRYTTGRIEIISFIAKISLQRENCIIIKLIYRFRLLERYFQFKEIIKTGNSLVLQ